MTGSLLSGTRPAFDERGIGRYHDPVLMAQVAVRAIRRGDTGAAMAAALLPGVLDVLVEHYDEWQED